MEVTICSGKRQMIAIKYMPFSRQWRWEAVSISLKLQ